MIEIAISEIGKNRMMRLLICSRCLKIKKRLFAAINNVEKQQFIGVGIDALQDEFLRRKVETIKKYEYK